MTRRREASLNNGLHNTASSGISLAEAIAAHSNNFGTAKKEHIYSAPPDRERISLPFTAHSVMGPQQWLLD